MTGSHDPERHLADLRTWRNRRAPDLSLGFLKQYFKREVAKPHKQVGRLVELWEQQVPVALAGRSRLVSFRAGVLTVEVPDSATLYQLDRHLRSGLERALRQASPVALRKIRLKVGRWKQDEADPR